ncbi:hypothetical protein EDB82DRAFT_82704 [Fusarium venenatum]|uniref:uncharacterized protein n=1 Tax=Fusarium venenatum TaxID=56646 RepID=UPI001DF79A3C|nr:hypothetical protein EDB82DRAFT_82704 [Fusarium venenatum]
MRVFHCCALTAQRVFSSFHSRSGNSALYIFLSIGIRANYMITGLNRVYHTVAVTVESSLVQAHSFPIDIPRRFYTFFEDDTRYSLYIYMKLYWCGCVGCSHWNQLFVAGLIGCSNKSILLHFVHHTTTKITARPSLFIIVHQVMYDMEFIERSRLEKYGLPVTFIMRSTKAIARRHELGSGPIASSFFSSYFISRRESSLF